VSDNLGDLSEDAVVSFMWTTVNASGAPASLDADTGTISIYSPSQGASTTQWGSGVTLTTPFDSTEGLHKVTIDTSNVTDGVASFTIGEDFSVVVTVGSVAGQSIVGYVLREFSIENRSLGQPTGATVAADIIALKAETVNILADTASMIIDTNALFASAVNSTIVADTASTVIDTNALFASAVNSTIKTTTDSILVDTASIVIDTNALFASAVNSTINTGVVSIVATVDGLNDISSANVATEISDALTVDTHTELTSVPPDDTTLINMLLWQFALARNKVSQSSTTKTLSADDGSASIATATISTDGVTVTRAEYIDG